jgi:hypothetical protein
MAVPIAIIGGGGGGGGGGVHIHTVYSCSARRISFESNCFYGM